MGTLLPWEKVPVREVEGWVIVLMPTNHQPAAALDHVILHGGLARSCRIHINSKVLPHGFCDFAFGFAQNDRVESMPRKIKIHQTGLELENSESICFVNHFPKFCG